MEEPPRTEQKFEDKVGFKAWKRGLMCFCSFSITLHCKRGRFQVGHGTVVFEIQNPLLALFSDRDQTLLNTTSSFLPLTHSQSYAHIHIHTYIYTSICCHSEAKLSSVVLWSSATILNIHSNSQLLSLLSTMVKRREDLANMNDEKLQVLAQVWSRISRSRYHENSTISPPDAQHCHPRK